MEFLRDPLWQFIGAFLAFVAIIISVIVCLFQRQCLKVDLGRNISANYLIVL